MNGQIATGQRRAPGQRADGEDDLLIARVRAKDMAAFERLYRNYHTRLSRFLLRLVNRPQLVEEVLNDTMMVVWEKADSFNGASKLSTWIFAIAYRKAMKALHKQDEPIADDCMAERISAEATPEEAFGHRRQHSLLLKAMGELSPDHRAVIDFTYFQEMGYREIASIMECPIDTVKTRMFHARRHLKRRMAGQLPDWL